MLLVLFQLGQDRYAVGADEVSEVLPMVYWKEVPHLPTGVVGLINRRGIPVPLVDLQLLLYGVPVRPHFGSRIMIVRLNVAGSDRSLGILAEQVTETIRREESDFVEAGVGTGSTPALGQVTEHDSSFIQLIHPLQLLSSDALDALYRTAGGTV